MKLYSDGTVTVTGGDTRVDGNGTAWLANVSVGAFLCFEGHPWPYQVAEILSDTRITLAQNVDYTAGQILTPLAYSIGDEFTPWNGLACPTAHSLDPHSLINRSLRTIDKLVGSPP